MINNETEYWNFMRLYVANLLGSETEDTAESEESIKDYYRRGNDTFQNEIDENEALQGAIEYAGSLESFAEDMWQEYHRELA